MATHEEESTRVQFPVGSASYQLLGEIGEGVSAVVHKAICVPMNSAMVAIKAIDLDQSRAKLDAVHREAKTLSLLSHPNILNAHCSFPVDHSLWVVMPFMAGGSLQSIISHSFPRGLQEPCIAVILKEILKALFYLHGQGQLHRDIKAGNILIDSNGLVKLADFGVSASIYEPNSSPGLSSSSSSSSLMLTDFAGTPYWMAPEVIHSHTGYGFKADIWSFGITALELAHGRPPLSHLPPSKSMILKITKRFRFSDLEKHKRGDDSKKFSKAFKDLVAVCLDQDPSKRPTAEKLLKHPFFKNCKGNDYLARTLLHGLPSVEERYQKSKIMCDKSTVQEDEEGDPVEKIVKHRRISGWNFNEDGLQLDPVFPTETKEGEPFKQVRFGGEIIIHEPRGDDLGESEEIAVAVADGVESAETAVAEAEGVESEENAVAVAEGVESEENAVAVAEGVDHNEPVAESGAVMDHSEPAAESGAVNRSERVAGSGGSVGVQREAMLSLLTVLRVSLVQQLAMIKTIHNVVTGSQDLLDTEEYMAQRIQKLDIELATEKSKNMALQLELNRFTAATGEGSASASSTAAVEESAFGDFFPEGTVGAAAEESTFGDVSAEGNVGGSAEESAFGDVPAEGSSGF